MKISQLIKHEDFYKILKKTIDNNSFFNNKNKHELIQFNSYEYLNIIVPNKISLSCVSSLIAEYSLHTSKIKKFIQNLYIFLVFKPIITNLFINKKIQLPKFLSQYAIVGGNHRIRLFDDLLNGNIVLLKDNENSKFISNEIKVRFNNKLDYCPKIFSFGKDWFVEEFIKGFPLNRTSNLGTYKDNIDEVVKKHFIKFNNKTLRELKLKTYLNFVLQEIGLLLEKVEFNNTKKHILETVNVLFDNIKNQNLQFVSISLTHGDFQKGNMRISDNFIYVLDWESIDDRFYLYDLFVFYSGIREGNSIKESLVLFLEKASVSNFKINNLTQKQIKLLLCVEELRFHINESISLNYFKTRDKLFLVLKEMKNLLYEI